MQNGRPDESGRLFLLRALYYHEWMKKIGLALSGGSALGIAHIGVLRALAEHDIPIDCIAGTSAGAVVAAAYAFGIGPDEMEKKSKDLSWRTFFKFSYSALGLTSNDLVGEMMKKLLGDVKIEDAKIPLAIIATDLGTGDKMIFRKGSVADAVMASTCLPGLFVPRKLHGTQFVDGGLVENVPLSPLAAMGADIKIGVNLERWRTYKPPKNFVDVMLDSIDIVVHAQGKFHPVPADVNIEPHLEQYTMSDWNKGPELVSMGHKAALAAVPEIERLIGPRRASRPAPKTPWYRRLWRWLGA